MQIIINEDGQVNVKITRLKARAADPDKLIEQLMNYITKNTQNYNIDGPWLNEEGGYSTVMFSILGPAELPGESLKDVALLENIKNFLDDLGFEGWEIERTNPVAKGTPF